MLNFFSFRPYLPFSCFGVINHQTLEFIGSASLVSYCIPATALNLLEMSVILATAGYDHKIRFWEAPSGICSRIIKYPDSQVNRLQITPDKQFIAAAGNPHIRLYEILNSTQPSAVETGMGGVEPPTQQPVLTLEGHTAAVTSIGFQRDGRYLYSGSEDGTIKVRNVT